MTTKYVIDIPSNRVIFFTQDENVNLVLTTSTVIYEDVNPPPEGLTLTNAWNWKLVGRAFVPQNDQGNWTQLTPEEQAFNDNKDATLKLLKNLINTARNKDYKEYDHTPYSIGILSSLSDDSNDLISLAKVKNIPLEELQAQIKSNWETFNKTIIRTEIWKEHFLTKINASTTNEELYAIRDEIGSTNFGRDLY